MLQINHLTKVYKNGTRAIDDLSLQIGKGMFGLLGPNGAGKSSLMRTIATLQDPDSGTIAFNNINVLKDQMSLRKVLGYLPQSFGVYPNISAEKLLLYFATLKGISNKKDRKKRVQEVLELVNLYEVRQKAVSGYSGGMKQRFGIAQLLLNNPQLIIVDEPTAGLDPAERKRFLNILREIGSANTVIFSTHIVEDVKELCNELAIMNHGKILTQSTPELIIESLKGKIWTTVRQRHAVAHPNTVAHPNQKYQILSSNYNPDNSMNIRVFAEKRPDDSFQPAIPNLEDVYFYALLQSNH